MASLQAQKAKLAFGQQAMMSQMQQQQEIMSSMLRMYAEMAKTSINNMR
jgi:hypothetical protein